MSVCLSSVNTITFEKNIGLDCALAHFFHNIKRKDEFVNQLFLNNGSGFIHQKRFLQNQKIYFPAKLCEIQKNIKK